MENFGFNQTVLALLIGGVIGYIPLVLIHELGHYFAAKAVGLTKAEIIWGLGNDKKRHPIVNAIGLTMAKVDFDVDEMMNLDWWKSLIVAIAGPLANFVTATLLLLTFSSPSQVLGLFKVAVEYAFTLIFGWLWLGSEQFLISVPAELVGSVEGFLATVAIWWGFLSILIGLFNLLPFPGMDGAHAVMDGLWGIATILKSARMMEWLDAVSLKTSPNLELFAVAANVLFIIVWVPHIIRLAL